MTSLFERTHLAGIPLENRIIRSATHESMGDEHGRPQAGLTDVYEKLSRGGVGGIITGLSGVQWDGRGYNNLPR